MTTSRIGEILGIVKCLFIKPGFQFVMRKIMRHISGQCNLAEGQGGIGFTASEHTFVKINIFNIFFEDMGGNPRGLDPDFINCTHDRFAANGQRSRSIGAHAKRNVRRVTMTYFNRIQRQTK